MAVTPERDRHWQLVMMLSEFWHQHQGVRTWDNVHVWASRFERFMDRGMDPVDDLIREVQERDPR